MRPFDEIFNETKLTPSPTIKIRYRRKPSELCLDHPCPYISCGKVYSSKASLKLHIKINHSKSDKLKANLGGYFQIKSLTCGAKINKGIELQKVFTQAHCEKLESRVMTSSTQDSTCQSDGSSQYRSSNSKNSINSIEVDPFNTTNINGIEV